MPQPASVRSSRRAEPASFYASSNMELIARIITTVVTLTLLLIASPASTQSVGVQGSAGPTLVDTGYSFAAGVRYSPSRLLTLVFGYDHTHLESRTRTTPDSSSSFRGGTLFLGTAELQVTPFGRHRWGPYGLAGLAAGQSRPNVNAQFPNRVTNRAGAIFFGGGVHVPVGTRASVFVDGRLMAGAEGVEGIVAVAPVRLGMAWSF